MELSIVIPFYQHQNHLKKLLHSILDSIVGSVFEGKSELIIVIDSIENSIEEISQLVREVMSGSDILQYKVIKNAQNRGVAISRNNGLEIAEGKYIHFIDQDDEISPDFYKLIGRSLENSDFILTNGYFSSDEGHKKYKIFYLAPELTTKNLILDNFIRSPGQVVIKRSVIGNLKFPVTSQYKGCDDRYFWILIFLNNPGFRSIYLPEPIYLAHLHEENFSNDSLQLFKCALEAWANLKDTDFGLYSKYVNQNIQAFQFITRQKRDFTTFISFLRFNLRLNKIIRSFIKRF